MISAWRTSGSTMTATATASPKISDRLEKLLLDETIGSCIHSGMR